LFALIVLLLVGAPLRAEQMQYLVFEVSGTADITPVFHAQRSTTRSRWPTQQKALSSPAASTDGVIRIHARAYAGADLLYAEAVELPLLARTPAAADQAELHGEPLTLKHNAFVLKLPVTAERVVLDTGSKLQTIDLRDLQARSEQLPLAALARSAQVHSKRRTGPASNRVDLLVVGEGFIQTQRAIFDARVDAFEAGFFNFQPLRQYQSLFNVERLFVASAEMGADHPPYRANCTGPECCSDQEAINDPRAPRFVDTAFDGSFCMGGNIHRALGISVSKLLAAASAVPDWDVIVVLVNDPVYGGLGYNPTANRSMPGIAVGSDSNSIPLMAHELGHSLGLLADEYSTDLPPAPPFCSDRDGQLGCRDNLTDETDPQLIKWRAWLTPGLPLPTTNPMAGVGLFEGVYNVPRGLYRPTHSACKMRDMRLRFCPVCTEAMVATLYDGRFGHPASGIDLIEPGTETPDPARPVQVIAGRPQNFSAAVLLPHSSIERQWLLDGEPVVGADGDTLDLTLDDSGALNRSLELRVIDRGPFLRSHRMLPLAVHSRTWTLQVQGQGADDFAICSALSGSWYNPLTPGQGVFLDVAEDPSILFAGWFTWDGVGAQQWYTLQGAFAPGSAAAEVPLYASTGGRFDDPAAVVNTAIGSANLEFLDCERAIMQYRFDDGQIGEIGLRRLLPAPASCTSACRR
jgi:hypothetical protein